MSRSIEDSSVLTIFLQIKRNNAVNALVLFYTRLCGDPRWLACWFRMRAVLPKSRCRMTSVVLRKTKLLLATVYSLTKWLASMLSNRLKNPFSLNWKDLETVRRQAEECN